VSQHHTAPCSFSHNSPPTRLLCPIPLDHPERWIVMPGSSGTSSYAAPVCWLWNIPVLKNEFCSTLKTIQRSISLPHSINRKIYFIGWSCHVLSAWGLFTNLAWWPCTSWSRVSHFPVLLPLLSRFGRAERWETLGSSGWPFVSLFPSRSYGIIESLFLERFMSKPELLDLSVSVTFLMIT